MSCETTINVSPLASRACGIGCITSYIVMESLIPLGLSRDLKTGLPNKHLPEDTLRIFAKKKHNLIKIYVSCKKMWQLNGAVVGMHLRYVAITPALRAPPLRRFPASGNLNPFPKDQRIRDLSPGFMEVAPRRFA